MARVYDNWERLVAATLDREKLRELALAPSRETSFSSSIADDFDSSSNFEVYTGLDDAPGGRYLMKPILMAERVIAVADGAAFFRQECLELKSKAEKIALLLWAGLAAYQLYERPALRIVYETERALEKALALVLKCRGDGLMKRVFAIIPAPAFRKMSSQLENSIGDVSWLLRVSAPAEDRAGEYLGLPPIAANEPILGLIWEQIAILYTGSVDDRADAAASLVSLARGSYRYGKLIIEEGGAGPLLKLVNERESDGQENAARVIGLLGIDPESVEHMIHAGACSVFAKILKEGPMKVQAVVAWAVSEFAAHYPKCQDCFAQHDIVQLLVGHLAFETVQEHSYHDAVSKATSMHPAAGPVSCNDSDGAGENSVISGNSSGDENCLSLCGASDRAREIEDPATIAHTKAMAARALGNLAKGNSPICLSITESRALLCLAVYMEKGPEEVRYYSVMTLLEITAVAGEDAELSRSAFNPNSPYYKAVVDQLFRIVEEADSKLLIPCIKAIGNLASTFKALETRRVRPLVKLLDIEEAEREAEASREACIALTKFACPQNFHCVDHSKAIIDAEAAKHLVQLVYFGEQIIQRHALILLCYVAMHVPNSGEFTQAQVLTMLRWASKYTSHMQNFDLKKLVRHVKYTLKLHQPGKPMAFL